MGKQILTRENKTNILRLYEEGNSSQEIKDTLNLRVTVRSIQRYLKREGVVRSVGDSFRLALKKGRVTYHKKPGGRKKRTRLATKLRTEILTRDGYRCVLCGATAETTRIQVDHIDNNPTNHLRENLQTLCEECNHGKSFL